MSAIVIEDATVVQLHKKIPASILHASMFRRNGNPRDPAGLCDGGDWVDEVQIRINDDSGNVYISVRPMEREDWWHLDISWQDFTQLMLAALKNHPSTKHETRGS